jgi:[NiFe] hydrogenase assembly HybE family chaperone
MGADPATSREPPADPAGGVARAFARAAVRFRGLPVCNPALRVEVVGLRRWEGEWLGVVVSPWTVSLVLVPGDGGRLRPLGPDERQRWSFPLGDYEFLGAHDPELGAYQTCSLLSPPWELASHAEACAAAAATLDALLAPPQAGVAPGAAPGPARGAAAAGAEPGPGATPARGPGPRTLSRRAFLGAGRRGAP